MKGGSFLQGNVWTSKQFFGRLNNFLDVQKLLDVQKMFGRPKNFFWTSKKFSGRPKIVWTPKKNFGRPKKFLPERSRYPGGKTPLLSHLNLGVFSKTLQILAVSRGGEGKFEPFQINFRLFRKEGRSTYELHAKFSTQHPSVLALIDIQY